MSAAPPSSPTPRSPERVAHPPMDMSRLRSRRRQARRQRRLIRVDLGLGLLGAIVLLLITPGLAIATLAALALLALCLMSVVLERRSRGRRARETSPSRAKSQRAGG